MAISPTVRVPWDDPALFEIKVGPPVKDRDPPLPSTRVSVKFRPLKVTFPLFKTVIE